ncbi:MAG: GNAT family N-acetyltransferase [Anaerolineae bacterium]|nr:GNAT family N-acetyltransferase [Anaerolineae bacterium]
MEFPVAPKLPDDVLAKQTALPRRPAPVTLTGRRVRLVPLDLDRDVEPLFRITNGSPITLGDRTVEAYDADERVWRYMPAGPFATADELAAYLRGQLDAPDALPMCVYEVTTDQPIGAATFMSNWPQHLKIELGNIWYSPLAQRTGANAETTLLMLDHAFALGYRRVEWKCDALNERSRRSALRMGFQFEGIQECHYIVKGRSRDTAWFRLLDREWPEARLRLQALLPD